MNRPITLSDKIDLQEEILTPDSLDLECNLNSELDLNELVKSASRVIAPLGPITNFAARNPWMGLEDQSFAQVARWLKDIHDIDIYPSVSILQVAKEKGEINQSFIGKGLQQWLDIQSLDLPLNDAMQFCRSALKLDKLPIELLKSPEIKRLTEKMIGLKLPIRKYSWKTYSLRLAQQGIETVGNDLDRHIIKWCKLFLDESQAAWSLPNREEGFYRAWRRLVQYDPALSRSQRQILKNCPQGVNAALRETLSELEIPQSQIQDYLEAHLLSLPGWAGMMLWRSQQSTQENSLLTEYLAVRILMESVLLKPYLPLPEQNFEESFLIVPLIAAWIQWGGMSIKDWSKLSFSAQKARLILAFNFDDTVRKQIWLESWEKTYEEQLKKIITSKQFVLDKVKTVLAQFAFCIDVRSEPFRHELEKAGTFETYGVAGFFGLPIETSKLGSKHSHPSLPVMQKPKHKIKEFSTNLECKQYQQRHQVMNSLGYTFKTMKQNLLTNLLLPEVSGPWLSMQMLLRSFFPRTAGRAFQQLRQSWLNKPSTKLSLDYMQMGMDLPVGFSEKEKVSYVLQSLKMMGLTNNFAPLVVICGHGSHTTNNPYAAALDCGACGGASGGFNARVLATLCNLPEVRQALATEGIIIPKDTVFAAAEHITTLDELHWLYVPELSDVAQEAFDCIHSALPIVSEQANAKRISLLPKIGRLYKNPMLEAQRFAEDWSEVRPEWGLARNAAFIIGERQLTKGCDLGGRVFLHNYNWKNDKDGTLLSNIINGPVKVSQWINLQYYASTVSPHYYGSGNKATQTVTAGIGVMQGNASDLLFGLPWQSVMLSDLEAYHAPLRLLVVIQAPMEYVEQLLVNDPVFHQKIQNGWIRLASIDSEGHWKSWS